MKGGGGASDSGEQAFFLNVRRAKLATSESEIFLPSGLESAAFAKMQGVWCASGVFSLMCLPTRHRQRLARGQRQSLQSGWKNGKRILYLHITHVGTVAPVELTLGVVTGPPKNWAFGT